MINYCMDCADYCGYGKCRSKGFSTINPIAENLICFTPKKQSMKVFSAKDYSAMNTPTTEKKCKVCGRILPLDKFGPNVKSPDGHSHICKECRSKMAEDAWKKRKSNDAEKIAKGVSAEIVKQVTENLEKKQTPGWEKAVLRDVPVDALIDELRARGWQGTLVRKEEITL